MKDKAYLVVFPRLMKKYIKLKAESIKSSCKRSLKINQKDKDLSP